MENHSKGREHTTAEGSAVIVSLSGKCCVENSRLRIDEIGRPRDKSRPIALELVAKPEGVQRDDSARLALVPEAAATPRDDLAHLGRSCRGEPGFRYDDWM
jgi:hypothetical protein